MLRRTKSSSLLPLVKLTNYFYPESPSVTGTGGLRLRASGTASGVVPRDEVRGSLTSPPDYEALYQAMQVEKFDDSGNERVRKKYACQGHQTQRCFKIVC